MNDLGLTRIMLTHVYVSCNTCESFVMPVVLHKQTMFSIKIWCPLLEKQRASLDRRVCVLMLNENR